MKLFGTHFSYEFEILAYDYVWRLIIYFLHSIEQPLYIKLIIFVMNIKLLCWECLSIISYLIHDNKFLVNVHFNIIVLLEVEIIVEKSE